MADSNSEQQLGYVSLKQIVKVGDDSVLSLFTYILPNACVIREEGTSPYEWFTDLVNQELLACAHDLLFTKATMGVAEGGTKNEPLGQFHFRKSSSFRGLFVSKPSTTRYHLLLPNKSIPSAPSGVCAAFISEYGRKVLPFFQSSSKGQGYSSFKMLPDCLHAYVDCCEVSSSLGIFKVFETLNPKHKVSLDIASYFRPRETDRLSTENFPEVPTAGLRRSRRKPHLSKPSKQTKSKDVKVRDVPPSQPLIDDTLGGVVKSATEMDLPKDVMDSLFDFQSQPDNEGVAPVDSGESTSPEDQLPPRKKILHEGACRQEKSVTRPLKLRGKQSSVSGLIRSSGMKGKSLVLKKKRTLAKSRSLESATSTSDPGSSRPLKSDSLQIVMPTSEMAVLESDPARSTPVVLESDSAKSTTVVLESDSAKSSSEQQSLDQEDIEFSPTEEKCPFSMPSTPLLPCSDTSQVVSTGWSDVENNMCLDDEDSNGVHRDGVHRDGVGGDGVERHGVDRHGGDSNFCENLLSPMRLLDDVTNVISSGSSSKSGSKLSSHSSENLEDYIQISSEEEVVYKGSEKRPKKQLSLAQILNGVERVSDLSRSKMIQWLRLRRPVILEIFKGRTFSQRHTDYVTSGKKRAGLVHCVDTSMFTADGLDCLHTNLLRMFCAKDMKYFDYVMSVLVPECVVRIIADINGVSFEEGEKLMYSYGSLPQDLESESDD